MTQSHKKTINHTTKLTYEWISQLDDLLGWDDKDQSFHIMRVTLRALRDVLPVEEIAQLSAQLPMLVRGLFYEGWDPSGYEQERHDKEGFVERVKNEMLPAELENPELAISAVFVLLSTRISTGEINDVRSNLRKDLRKIWPTNDD